MHFRKSIILAGIFFGFSLMAMEGQEIQKLSKKYFQQKINNLNDPQWDKQVKNSQDQDCLEIWVPNLKEYLDHYSESGLALPREIDESYEWIRARLPTGWSVHRKSAEQGTYRIVQDQQRQNKMGIAHYLIRNGDRLKQEGQVTFFDDQQRVKKKVF